jgi:hypothetical protein
LVHKTVFESQPTAQNNPFKSQNHISLLIGPSHAYSALLKQVQKSILPHVQYVFVSGLAEYLDCIGRRFKIPSDSVQNRHSRFVDLHGSQTVEMLAPAYHAVAMAVLPPAIFSKDRLFNAESSLEIIQNTLSFIGA